MEFGRNHRQEIVRHGIVWLFAGLTLLTGQPGLGAVAPEQARTLLLQSASEWRPGDRIRVLSPEPYRIPTSGWFTGIQGDSVLQMRVSQEEPPLSMRLHQIGTLEERTGVKRHWRTGAAIGLGVGLVAGLAYASSHGEETIEIPGLVTLRTRGLRESYIAISALSGFVLGGAVGLVITSDRWGMVASFD